MKNRHVIALLCILLLAMDCAKANIANPRPFSYRQPDGSQITVTLHGDEFSAYYLSAQGDTLQPTDDGWLRPGHPVNIQPNKHNCKAARRLALSNSMALGSPRALILLVEYPDCKFTFAKEEFEAMINEHGYSRHGGTGSALDYFTDCSGGLFTPQFDVVGPVMLPHNRAYYGKASGNTYDVQPWLMLTEGAPMLDDDVDFSQYDNDGDGFVDNVFIFYAGMGQNDGGPAEAVWPHAANIYTYYNIDVVLDGVKLGAYACTNELLGVSTESAPVITGIGTFCHEYSHVLGLPDMYSTNGTKCFSPGAFELMDSGSYNNQGRTPPMLSAYSRAVLGWVNPRTFTAPETVVLDTDAALRILTPKDSEYYLLENRQQTGWDKYLPAHGMLVWHVDYDVVAWEKNQVNVLPQHQRIDLVEADGILSTATLDGDSFPGRNGVSAFNPTSWTGIPMDAAITDIREMSGYIHFKYRGGGDRLPAPESLPASDITPTGFTACWMAEPLATTYEVDIFEGGQVVPMRTQAATASSLQCGESHCALAITQLAPSTTYRYTVRAADSELKSPDSQPQYVTTLPPTFDMVAPESLPATDVTAEGFTAHWQPMKDAVAYELTIYTTHPSAPDALCLDFTGGISNLPEGWITTCTSTDSRKSYCGESAPSLRMVTDGDYLQSPLLEGIVSVEFWEHASNAEGSITVSQEKDTGDDNHYRVRFTHHGSQISYIDDIVILYGGQELPDTLATISSTIPDLAIKMSDYTHATSFSGALYYTVRGINAGGLLSLPSTPQCVEMPEGIRLNYYENARKGGNHYDENLREIHLTPVTLSPSRHRVTLVRSRA